MKLVSYQNFWPI